MTETGTHLLPSRVAATSLESWAQASAHAEQPIASDGDSVLQKAQERRGQAHTGLSRGMLCPKRAAGTAPLQVHTPDAFNAFGSRATHAHFLPGAPLCQGLRCEQPHPGWLQRMAANPQLGIPLWMPRKGWLIPRCAAVP